MPRATSTTDRLLSLLRVSGRVPARYSAMLKPVVEQLDVLRLSPSDAVSEWRQDEGQRVMSLPPRERIRAFYYWFVERRPGPHDLWLHDVWSRIARKRFGVSQIPTSQFRHVGAPLAHDLSEVYGWCLNTLTEMFTDYCTAQADHVERAGRSDLVRNCRPLWGRSLGWPVWERWLARNGGVAALRRTQDAEQARQTTNALINVGRLRFAALASGRLDLYDRIGREMARAG